MLPCHSFFQNCCLQNFEWAGFTLWCKIMVLLQTLALWKFYHNSLPIVKWGVSFWEKVANIVPLDLIQQIHSGESVGSQMQIFIELFVYCLLKESLQKWWHLIEYLYKQLYKYGRWKCKLLEKWACDHAGPVGLSRVIRLQKDVSPHIWNSFFILMFVIAHPFHTMQVQPYKDEST